MATAATKKSKDTDFKVIEKSSEAIAKHLKIDEAVPDLEEQFRASSQDSGRHRYFLLPYRNLDWGQAVEQMCFVPFPEQILSQYRKVECASFMGLIPEIHRAWITVDNRLYLWNYMKPQECDVYEGLNETILSVSLSAPRPGIFLDTVKYVLVLATAVEVILLAISWEQDGSNLRLIPTTYKVPTDNIIMVKVIGSQSGRIFMAGNDGNMYELYYRSTESPWGAVFGTGRTHKCRKINHSAWNWKLVHLVPPFLQTMLDVNDSLIDLTVDDLRNVLYSISARGVLSAFYLGADSNATSPPIVREMKLFEEIQKFLSYQLPPESSPHASVFRDIRSMSIIGLHIVPLTESRTVHLMVMLNNGIRIYLRLISADRTSYSPGYGMGGNRPPIGVEIVYLRNPPSPDAIRSSLPEGHVESSMEAGSVPAYMPMRHLKIHTAMYSHGMLLTAMEKDNAKDGDDLMCLFEDLAGRNAATAMPSSAATITVFPSQAPSMREGICIPHGLTGLPSVNGKIQDIRESCMSVHCNTPSALQSLYAESATSAAAFASQDDSPHNDLLPYDSSSDPSECPPGPAQAIARAGQPNSNGLQANNLVNVATLGEIARQYIPCPTHSLQRQFICLTNRGVHVLHKIRPIDSLYRFLSLDNFQESYSVRDFFALYGTVESACMCLAIACGLPADAGGARNLDPSVIARDPAQLVVQKRAVSAMLANSVLEPSFRSVIASAMAGGNTLFGRAMDTRLVNSPISPDMHITHSPVHDAIQQLASRILRPVWYRAIAAPMTKKNGPLGSLSPIWTRDLISCIRTPLGHLLKLLEMIYPDTAAVGSSLALKGTSLDGPSSSSQNGRQLLTRQMEMQANLNKNPEKILLEQARAMEDSSLKGLYRLVSRSVHAFALIDLLRSAQEEKKLPVPWGTLKKISFRSLVCSEVAHDKMKKILLELLGGACKKGETALADQITLRLTSECNQYFSSGDRYTYEATRSLDSLRKNLTTSLSRSSPAMIEQVSRCVDLLCKSSSSWRSLSDVKDDPLLLTEEPSSELSKSCALLRAFGEVGRMGIVNLCITTSHNFNKEEGSSNRALTLGSTPQLGTLPGALPQKDAHNSALYHGGPTLAESDLLVGRTACYECLLKQILSIKESTGNLGGAVIPPGGEVGADRTGTAVRTMVQHALSVCVDPLFLSLLFDCLSEHDPDTLTKLRPSEELEDYLRKKDPMLLYKYYRLHGLYVQAAQHMDILARTESDIDISLRIEYLNRAVSSASAACDVTVPNEVGTSVQGPQKMPSQGTNGIVEEYLVELEGKREIARYQLTAFELLDRDFRDLESQRPKIHSCYSEGQRKSMEALSAVTVRLHFKLVGISELFNEICLPYKLWEVCLLLMHATRTDNPELASKLLRSILYRIIPGDADSPEGRSFLASKRTAENIFTDQRRQQRSFSFESHPRWIGRLSDDVTALGSQLHSVEGDFAFPLVLLLEELEDIASALCSQGGPNVPDRGWTGDTMQRIGLSCGATVEFFLGYTDKWGSKTSEQRAHLLSSVSHCMTEWRRISMRQSSSRAADIEQFYQVVRSGRLRVWIDKIRRHTPNPRNENLSEFALKSVAIVDAELEEMKNYVNELMILS